MSKLKVWIRMIRLKAKSYRRHILYRRWVRESLHYTFNVPFPGSKKYDRDGVSIYNVLSYFLISVFGGSLAPRSKGLAFSFLMALPPLMIFVFSLIAYFPVDGLQNELLSGLDGIIPAKILSPVSDTINDVMGHKHSTLLSIGFISSVFLAANGMYGIIQSLNFTNSSVENRSFFTRFLICIALVFILYLLIVLVLCLLIGHKLLLQFLISQGILTDSSFSTLVFNIVRWVLLSLATLFALSLIYWWAPVKQYRVGFFSPGSVIATGMFFLLTWGLGVYLNNFSRYNLLYGSIGTLLMLMLWIYFSCIVLLVGYELNASICNGSLRSKNRIAKKELKDRIQIFKDDNTKEPRESGA